MTTPQNFFHWRSFHCPSRGHYGNVVDKSKRDSAIDGDDNNPNNLLLKKSDVGKMTISSKKDFRPINNYKPTGNLIYGDDLFKKIEDKL